MCKKVGSEVADSSGWPTAAIPAHFFSPSTGSFTEFLADTQPEVLPKFDWESQAAQIPHGTTIVALTYRDGVIMAGDRRATSGNIIAQRDIQKVFVADAQSLVGIAGSAGVAIELVRLFQLELEHYEKIEGTRLSLDGKANRLAAMIRGNLAMALRGLAVVPLFAGFDQARPADAAGRIFSFDVTGGRYEEHDYHAVGSGSLFAKSALKKRHKYDVSEREAVRTALEALYDAADDDSATGGPDVLRGIYPVVAVADGSGSRRVADDEIAQIVAELLEDRRQRPGG